MSFGPRCGEGKSQDESGGRLPCICRSSALSSDEKVHRARLVVLCHAAAADGDGLALKIHIGPSHSQCLFFSRTCQCQKPEIKPEQNAIFFVVFSVVAASSPPNSALVRSTRLGDGFSRNWRVSGSRSIKFRSRANLSTLRNAMVSRLTVRAEVPLPSRFFTKAMNHRRSDLVQSHSPKVSDPTLDGLSLAILRALLLLCQRRACEVLLSKLIELRAMPSLRQLAVAPFCPFAFKLTFGVIQIISFKRVSVAARFFHCRGPRATVRNTDGHAAQRPGILRLRLSKTGRKLCP